MSAFPSTTTQLRTLITPDERLTLSFVEVPVAEPGPGDVVVRVDAAPINPSDLGLLIATVDAAELSSSGKGAERVTWGPLVAGTLKAWAGRVGQSLPVGNEAGGVVVAAGSSPAAQALLGKVVGMFGGAMYAGYRTLPAEQCLAMPDGVTAAQAASPFVNPMTALALVETMRRDGHTALIHTAAASNLGQMLVKICLADDVPLINVVRHDDHIRLLTDLGAMYVLNSAAPSFVSDMTAAIAATNAGVVFDAIGGGRLVSQILGCMEAAAVANATEYSRYGSSQFKQAYIYGSLDPKPTELVRNFGYSWSVSGWLLTPFLQKFGPATTSALRDRVAREITTTFASTYTETVSLTDALDPEHIRRYAKRATGEKYLIAPHA